jgi:adenylate cyclase
MIDQQFERDPKADEIWRNYLRDGFPNEGRLRHFFRFLPTSPRCKKCYAPFKGVGGAIVRLTLNKRPSPHNPLMCNACEEFASRNPGGAEVEMSMLFADVRGSTALAEKMSPLKFSQLINRFYNTSVEILANRDAVIDRLVGDEMIGYFLPNLSGPQHARLAIQAAQELLVATGHHQPDGPWIPIGIGVHTGVAYFGVVGTKDGVIDITALGNTPNTAARLASLAAKGEILISESAFEAAGLDVGETEKRSLTLKGVSEPVPVRVLFATGKNQSVVAS